jgi:hypothetical protein
LSLSIYANSPIAAGTIELEISATTLLRNDPESTQLFIDNVLLPSPNITSLKKLCLQGSGVSLKNLPLMVGFHKNTAVTVLLDNGDAATRVFVEPILQRNVYLRHVHVMLGTGTLTTFQAAGPLRDEIVVAPTIPPPCGLWAIVMAKVGQGGAQGGATPLFRTVLDQLIMQCPQTPQA